MVGLAAVLAGRVPGEVGLRAVEGWVADGSCFFDSLVDQLGADRLVSRDASAGQEKLDRWRQHRASRERPIGASIWSSLPT